CVTDDGPSGTDPPDTTAGSDTTQAPTTDAPSTTVATTPASTAPPSTAPASTAPPLTMPVNTEPPMTMPTVPNTPAGTITELNIASEFAPPAGYTFSAVPGGIDTWIDDIAADRALGPVTSQLGAVQVFDSAGNG